MGELFETVEIRAWVFENSTRGDDEENKLQKKEKIKIN